MARTTLTRDDLPDLLRRVHRALAARRSELDELNVFPVPDGDTGSNMTGTLAAVVEALDARSDTGEDDLAATVVRAALRGARGNSGVILSQVLRGLVEHLDGGTAALATALQAARERAYAAVSQPVEGTILTAVRAAAEAAAAAADRDDSLAEACAHVLRATTDAVEATTAQLEALREAGVVDAGARGFEVLLAAVGRHVTGEDEPAPAAPVSRRDRGDRRREMGSVEFAYEVQYLLDAGDAAVEPLRRALDDLGDSVVVVSSGDLLSVHVHTNDVGAAIEAGVAHGRPSRIEVTRFEDQVAAQQGGTAPTVGDGDHVGCVAVLPGPGLRRVAEQHGAVVVDGRAGDLPTVAALAEAVGRQRARVVALLPGHRNAVPTAEQVARLVADEDGRTVTVVAAADGPVEVLAALAVCDPNDPATVGAADAAVACCHSGEVVPATRDACTPIGDVRRGQWLCVVDDEVTSVHDDALDALEQLAQRLPKALGGEAELATLLVGADGDPDAAGERVRAVLGDAELEVIDGGQWPARYVLGVE